MTDYEKVGLLFLIGASIISPDSNPNADIIVEVATIIMFAVGTMCLLFGGRESKD